MRIIAQAFLTRKGLSMVKGGVATRAARSLTIHRPLAPLRTNFLGGADDAPRNFSSDARNNLIEILDKYRDNDFSKNEWNYQDLRIQLEEDWEIMEDGATTIMFMKEKKVQVSFHCQNGVISDYDPSMDSLDSLMDSDGTKSEIDHKIEDRDEYYTEYKDEFLDVRFCVTVSKDGKTLVIHCTTYVDDEYPKKFNIDEVFITTTAPDAIHADQGNPIEKDQYQGPNLFSFKQYIEEKCGINSDVICFIAAFHSDYRTGVQYQQFLKDAQSIISAQYE